MSEDAPKIPLPQPHFDKLLENRILWVGTDVNDTMAADLCAKMLLLSAEDPKADITMYINSPGGSVTAGMSIYDIMQLIPNDVATVATGMAASMGQFLLTAGAKGKRYITPNARVLLHQPLGGFGGAATDVRIQAELINDMKHRLASITAANTGKTVEQVIEDGDRDNWFTAEEALDYGFVDHIVSHVKDVHNIVITKKDKA